MDEKVVSVKDGYSGSSKDHYYLSRGLTEEASHLLRRRRACGCQPCLKLIPFCLLTEDSLLSAGTTPRATAVKLCASGPTPAARHTRNARNPLPSFCEESTIGQNVIVRVRDDERATNPDEDYFVGKIEKKPLKLDKDGTYSAVLYKKNDWITSIRWYEFVPSKRDDSGDRFYKKGIFAMDSLWIDNKES